MKKIYYLIAITILMASTFAVYHSRNVNKEQIQAKALTPQEIWQKEYQKKKAKRKKGYCKSDKPDMYSEYFEAITTEIGKSKSGYPMNYKTQELKKAQQHKSQLKSATTAYTFVQRGPANVGGRTRAIVVDPDDPNKNTWYAGSATGGIWKTTDAADNWTDISGELSNLSVNALVMANSNHDILYAGTGESFPGGSKNHGNGIWKSEDRGVSWTQLASTAGDNNFTYINRLFVDPVDANIVIAATQKGILKSVNGGTNWTKVYTCNYGVQDLAAYPSARDTIYAGEYYAGVLRTIDGGDSWQLFSNGLDVGDRHEVAVSPVDRNCVFASVNHSSTRSEVYFSNDNANNWTKFDDDQNFLGGQGRYNNIIEAHPFNDSEVFVGGVDLWKVKFNKTDPSKVYFGQKQNVSDAYREYGGDNNYDQNWGFGTTKIPGLHPDHHNLTMIPSDDGENFRIVNGNDGGVAVSEDNGVTFTQKPNNYITTQFYGVAKHPTANEYIGGLQDNGTWQSQSYQNASSTSHYYYRIGGDGFECLWHPTEPKKILGSVYYNDIRRSTDGGLSWSAVQGITDEDGPFITRLSHSPQNPDVVFAVGNRGVYKSIDFGANWSMKTISSSLWSRVVTSQHNVEVSLANPNIVWAGSMLNSLEMIHVSEDEGESFTAVSEYADRSMNVSISGIATHPSEDSTAYVLFSLSKTPKILRTKDLGATWEDISGFGTGEESTNGFPDVITHCLLVMPHEPSILWAGTEIGLFESTDDGVSWHAVNGNLPPVSVYDMHIVGDQVVIATHGRGIWTTEASQATDVETVTDNSAEFKVYPNPCRDEFQLQLDANMKEFTLEIFSLNGKKMHRQQSQNLGVNTIKTETLEKGFYIVRIAIDGEVLTKKIQVL